jgi:uncharacterized protein with FMN-binding domain
MKRAPIVLGSTAVGLGLVLTFHTHSPSLSKLSVGATAGAGPTPPASSPPTTAGNGSQPGPATTTPATTAPSSTRTATGQDVQYQYGDIELQVTESGSRITKVKVLRNGAVDARSAEINSQAVPMLQDQTMQAQSANIDGVSGATFTSYAYAQSLQSALDQLHA